VQGAYESVKKAKGMECDQADDEEDRGPNPRMQGEHLLGGSSTGMKTEAVVLHSYNVGNEQKGGQKKDNNKAVDNDDGQKPILERFVDNMETLTLIPVEHMISFLVGPHK